MTIKYFLTVLFIICINLSLILSILFNSNLLTAAGSDYMSFATGASVIKSGEGDNLYDLGTQLKHQRLITGISDKEFLLPFRNLPFVATIFLPFSFMSLTFGYKLFGLINILLLNISVYFIGKYLGLKKIGLWALIPFIFYPTYMSVVLGQLSIIDLIIYLSLFQNLKKKNYFLSGLNSGLILIKLQFIIVIPLILFLIKDKLKYLKGFLLSTSLIIFISLLTTGFDGFSMYLPLILATENSAFGSRPFQMLSIFSKFPYNWELSFVINGILYLVLAIIFFIRRKVVKFEKSFSLLILITLAFSIHVLTHDLMLLLIPITIFLKEIDFKSIKGLYHFAVVTILYLSSFSIIFNITVFVPIVFLMVIIFTVMKVRSYETQT